MKWRCFLLIVQQDPKNRRALGRGATPPATCEGKIAPHAGCVEELTDLPQQWAPQDERQVRRSCRGHQDGWRRIRAPSSRAGCSDAHHAHRRLLRHVCSSVTGRDGRKRPP
jgi:hypothetical protein